MAVSRRPRRRSRTNFTGANGNATESVKVSFIGDEIDRAIEQIVRISRDLPPDGQRAGRIAATTLRHCKRIIKFTVRCRSWGL